MNISKIFGHTCPKVRFLVGLPCCHHQARPTTATPSPIVALPPCENIIAALNPTQEKRERGLEFFSSKTGAKIALNSTRFASQISPTITNQSCISYPLLSFSSSPLFMLKTESSVQESNRQIPTRI